MSERISREQALERVGNLKCADVEFGHTRWCASDCEHTRIADLLLAVQAESEARVVAKCCEFAEMAAKYEILRWNVVNCMVSGRLRVKRVREIIAELKSAEATALSVTETK